MNNDIKITYRGKNVFDLAMKLAFTSEYKEDKLQEVVGYKIHNNTMYLFDYKSDTTPEGFIELPYKMGLDEIILFVWGWLLKTKSKGHEPDTDGSVHEGFTITTDGTDWRGGSGFYNTFIAIRPTWIVYGK